MFVFVTLVPLMALAIAVAVAPLVWAVRRREGWDRAEHDATRDTPARVADVERTVGTAPRREVVAA